MNITCIIDKIQEKYKQEIQYQESLSNFSVNKLDDFIEVMIHYEKQKRGIKIFIKCIGLIGVLIIPFADNYSSIFVPILIEVWFIIIAIGIYFMQTRIYLKVTKNANREVIIVKQGPILRKEMITTLHPSLSIVAQHRKWVGNKYYGKDTNTYELILHCIKQDGSSGKITSILDDRKFWFTGGRNNIKGILKEEEIGEIAKELELPYSVNKS